MKLKVAILVILLAFALASIPTTTLAAWWNPFSWKIGNLKILNLFTRDEVKIEQTNKGIAEDVSVFVSKDLSPATTSAPKRPVSQNVQTPVSVTKPTINTPTIFAPLGVKPIVTDDGSLDITKTEPFEILPATPFNFIIFGKNLKNNAGVEINDKFFGYFNLVGDGSLQKIITIEDPKFFSQQQKLKVVNPDGRSVESGLAIRFKKVETPIAPTPSPSMPTFRLSPDNASFGCNAPCSNTLVWQGVLSVENGEVVFNSLALRQIGTIINSQVGNFKISLDGVDISATPSLDSNGYANFNQLNRSLQEGSYTIKVFADILFEPCVICGKRTVQMSLRNMYDIKISDSKTGTNLPANQSASFPFGPTAFEVGE